MLKFEDLIYQKKDAITKQQCAEFIEWFWNNQDLHVQGKVYGGYDSSDLNNVVNLDRKNTTQAYPKPDDPISDLITNIIFSNYDEYGKTLPIPQGQPMCATTYSVRVYRKNVGKFLEHVDQSAGPNVTRVFGVILYLNTVDEGGETDFLDYNLKVKPEAGKLVIFPCNYLYRHQGNIPISEDKYIVTAFINFADV